MNFAFALSHNEPHGGTRLVKARIKVLSLAKEKETAPWLRKDKFRYFRDTLRFILRVCVDVVSTFIDTTYQLFWSYVSRIPFLDREERNMVSFPPAWSMKVPIDAAADVSSERKVKASSGYAPKIFLLRRVRISLRTSWPDIRAFTALKPNRMGETE